MTQQTLTNTMTRATESKYRVATTEQIRKTESNWIAQCDPNWGQVLMEIAGRGAAQEAFDLWQQNPGDVAVFCGRGNNGGDGMVVARYLHQWGVPVKVWLVSANRSRSPHAELAMTTVESSTNRDILQKLGVEVRSFAEDLNNDEFGDEKNTTLPPGVTLVIDALLGTGLDRPVEGLFSSAIELIEGGGASVLSIDLPSGVNSDTGQMMGSAVKATVTVTFGYIKAGLLCYPGAELAGEIRLIDIGLPALGATEKPVINLSNVEQVKAILPTRPVNAHKGTFGYLLTVAGSLGMSGATLLSSESSLRVGAGLSILATPRSLVPHLPPREVIYRPIAETDEQSISPKAIGDLVDDLDKASAVVLGPGLSTNEETVSFVQKFVSKTLGRDASIPCIIDADGLNAIAENPKIFPEEARQFVITPHPKELSRLLDSSTQEIQKDRITSALNAATEFGCVVVLKGAHTVIADPDGNVFINPTGNPAMSTAGAGDVLSGIIGGLLAQGVEPLDAAIAGVYVHGRAGDLAAQELGPASVLAGDLMDFIPEALMSIHEEMATDLEHMFHPF